MRIRFLNVVFKGRILFRVLSVSAQFCVLILHVNTNASSAPLPTPSSFLHSFIPSFRAGESLEGARGASRGLASVSRRRACTERGEGPELAVLGLEVREKDHVAGRPRQKESKTRMTKKRMKFYDGATDDDTGKWSSCGCLLSFG